MLPVLRRLANNLGEVPEGGLLLTVKGEPMRLTTPELVRIRQQVLTRQPYNHGRAAAEEAIVLALWAKAPEGLDVQGLEQFDDLVRSSSTFRQLVSIWWPSMTAPQALRRLGDPAIMERVAGDELLGKDRVAVAASYTLAGWSVADIALLDELVHLLGTPPEDQEIDVFIEGGEDSELVTIADQLTDTRDIDTDEPHSTYAHVLVDEAQDITPIQWRMLRRRGPQASWTIVGDPAQSSWPDVDESRRALESLIGTSPSRTFRLSTNYRSPPRCSTWPAHTSSRASPMPTFLSPSAAQASTRSCARPPTPTSPSRWSVSCAPCSDRSRAPWPPSCRRAGSRRCGQWWPVTRRSWRTTGWSC